MTSRYETHVAPRLTEIAEWLREGAAVGEVARRLGVGASTLKGYLKRGAAGEAPFEALAQAFAERGRTEEREVESALLKRAQGFEYTEVTVKEVKDRSTGEVETLTTTTTKYVPPDTRSAIFWLTNRRPERWQYRPEGQEEQEDGGEGEEAGVILLAEPEAAVGEK